MLSDVKWVSCVCAGARAFPFWRPVVSPVWAEGPGSRSLLTLVIMAEGSRSSLDLISCGKSTVASQGAGNLVMSLPLPVTCTSRAKKTRRGGQM